MTYSYPVLRPELDIQSLKDTCEALRKFRPLKNNPFMGFVLLRRQTNSPHAPGLAAIQQLTYDLLSELIYTDYITLRRQYNLPPPDKKNSYQDAITCIEADTQTGNTLLIAASAIYHRYIRSDLEMSVDEIAGYAGYDERVIRRYGKAFWERLLQQIMRLEGEARREERYYRCSLAVPRLPFTPLQSQQNQLERGTQFFQTGDPGILMLKGVPGTGKSTLASLICQQVIYRETIADVAWLNLTHYDPPVDLAALTCEVLDLPVPPRQQSTNVLLQYLRLLWREDTRLLLVVDGIDGHEATLQRHQHWLSHCCVILTSRQASYEQVELTLHCGLLDAEETYQLLEYLEPGFFEKKDSHIRYQQIRALSDGNPALVCYTFRILQSVPGKTLHAPEDLRTYYLENWQQFSEITQVVWLLVAIFSRNQPVAFDVIQEIARQICGFSLIHIESAVQELIATGFLMHGDADYHYQASLTWQLLDSTPELLNFPIETVLEGVYAAHLDTRVLRSEVAFHLLTAGLQVMQRHFLPVIELGRSLALRHRRWQTWETTLQSYRERSLNTPEKYLTLDLNLAITFRWQGQLERAHYLLNNIFSHTSADELPQLLIEAHIEQSTIYLYRKRMPDALESAETAYHILQSDIFSPDLHHRCVIAVARALSTDKPEQARKWLETLENRDAVVWDLLAQIARQQGKIPEAIHAARQSLKLLDEVDVMRYARGLGNLGRMLIIGGEIDEGITAFQTALNLLQNTGDIFGLARMYNNCGVALMHNGAFSQARRYFQQALDLHHQLQDDHGEEIARENLIYSQAREQRSSGFLHDRASYHDDDA